jgi:hypothetical protein
VTGHRREETPVAHFTIDTSGDVRNLSGDLVDLAVPMRLATCTACDRAIYIGDQFDIVTERSVHGTWHDFFHRGCNPRADHHLDGQAAR